MSKKAFHFVSERYRKPHVAAAVQPSLQPEKEEIGLLRGIKPDSKEEWWFGKALMTLQKEFDYQVSLGGGRARSGGQILDFLVHTVPLYTPVFIQGKYWHSGKYGTSDEYKIARCQTLLKIQWGINAAYPEQIWSQFMKSEDEVLHIVRNLFR